ncbi:hypothetical protein FRC02_002215 [Tulasnella sp. 418]|nr:hypothetical protein FRC02_002215 [Tulasnella sp. 418]
MKMNPTAALLFLAGSTIAFPLQSPLNGTEPSNNVSFQGPSLETNAEARKMLDALRNLLNSNATVQFAHAFKHTARDKDWDRSGSYKRSTFTSERPRECKVGTEKVKCSLRLYIIKRDGTGAELEWQARGLGFKAGSWTSPYDGKPFYEQTWRGLTIDHVVPLYEAWIAGAYDWENTGQHNPHDFFNDVDNLLAVSEAANKAKGSCDPVYYLPFSSWYACQYAKIWIQIKTKYHLKIDPEEYSALSNVIEYECRNKPRGKDVKPPIQQDEECEYW